MPEFAPRKILLIRLRAIGDVVLVTPLLRALKKDFPRAELHVLTDPFPGTLLLHNPHVDRYRHSPPRGASLGVQVKALMDLRREGYDLVLDLFGNPRSAWMAFATGAKVRAGFAHRVRRFAYTHPVPKNKVRKYQVDVNLDVLRHLGIPDDGLRTELFLTDAEREWGLKVLGELKTQNSKLKTGINPTGSWSAKRWPLDHWGKLVELLSAKGIRPFIFTTPGDPEGVLPWAERMGEKVVLAPPTDLRQLASLISALDLLVGNDGAPQHIAQALGVKTLTLFGPTWGLSWNPPSDDRFRWLQNFPPCGPCDRTLCPNEPGVIPGPIDCLTQTTPDRTLKLLGEMLGG